MYLFYVNECFVCMCVYLPHGNSAQSGQKRVSDTLELELQTIVSQYVGARNQILVL